MDLINIIKNRKLQQLAKLDELAKSRFLEMFGDPVLNEKNWDLKKWKDALTIKNGKSQKNVLDANGKYPIYGSGGLMGRASAYIQPQQEHRRLGSRKQHFSYIC